MAGARSRSSRPALVNLAGALIWTGEFDEGERWLRRTARALETDTGPIIRLLLHMGTGMLMSGRRRRHRGRLRNTARPSTCRRGWKAHTH
jgi:hypothetical protein